MQKLPLDGIRITDFGQMWAGPHLTEWLSVMGAEVIKVESSMKIDFMRNVGTPPGFERTNPNTGSAFACLNPGKKSVTLNMKTERAQKIAQDLVKLSDVVTENYGGSVLDGWGLSYADQEKLRPGIIYYAGSGYGRTGPHKARPSYAEIVEAMDGSTYLNGFPGEGPATVGVSPWTDATQAMNGAFHIIAALHYRHKTGKGQFIDGAMIEGSTNMLGEMVMGYTMNGTIGERVGNWDKYMAPHNCFNCKGDDEWVVIAVSNEEEWQAFCKVMGNPEWTGKPEFASELSRHKNQVELDKLIDEWTRNYGQYEIMDMLQNAGVPAGASVNIKHLPNDPQLKARNFYKKMQHPVMGELVFAGLPFKLSDAPEGNYDPSPLLGEHNDYVLGELLGISKEEIAKLVEDKVVV